MTGLRRAGVADFTRAVLLASLDMADELFRAREERERSAGDVGARLGALAALLERATPPDAAVRHDLGPGAPTAR